VKPTYAFAADARSIAAASAWVEAQCDAASVEDGVGALLAMVTEEVVSNIVKYGGRPPPTVELRFSRTDAHIELLVSDDGIAFDPTTAPVPQFSDDLELREVGGLGIVIVRAMMDDVDYARDGGWNRLALRKNVAAVSGDETSGR